MYKIFINSSYRSKSLLGNFLLNVTQFLVTDGSCDFARIFLLLTSLSWRILICASFRLISSLAVRYKLEMFFLSTKFSSFSFWLWNWKQCKFWFYFENLKRFWLNLKTFLYHDYIFSVTGLAVGLLNRRKC